MEFDNSRVRILKDGGIKSGTVVYWMQRDMRVDDNWALLYAQKIALETSSSLVVIFNLVSSFPGANIRQYNFMIEGLKEVEQELTKLNISFNLLLGEPKTNIPEFIADNNVSILVTDFNPLKIVRKWKKEVWEKTNIPFYEVDAHNIIPMWGASDKLEFAAYTIRPKIAKQIDKYLVQFPKLKVQSGKVKNNTNWEKVYQFINVDTNVDVVKNIFPGANAAKNTLNNFIIYKLNFYNEKRNNPVEDYQSGLSPYLHFGHISAQTIALEIKNSKTDGESKDAFLEELIVRRELSDNFCYYNTNYDNYDGFPIWAKKSLEEHWGDKREFIYSLEEFENGNTHDPLWNAAQKEMVVKGKMHGYMRMYWCKKILEWTANPKDALTIAIYLNDKYQLDGRDPNGYVGITWSIGGVHDRAWFERPVYGKIRYMNYNGCAKKFDVKKYIQLNK